MYKLLTKNLIQTWVILLVFLSWIAVAFWFTERGKNSVNVSTVSTWSWCDSLATSFGYIEQLWDEAVDSWLYEKAIAHYREALECKEDAKIWNNLGYTLSKLWKELEAIEAYQKSIEIDPTYDFPATNLADIYIAKHFTAFSNKDYEWAILQGKSTLRYARNKDMIDDVTVNMAISYWLSNRLYEGFLILNERLVVQTLNPKLYAIRSELNFQNKNFDESIADMKTAIKLAPNDTKYTTRLQQMQDIAR